MSNVSATMPDQRVSAPSHRPYENAVPGLAGKEKEAAGGERVAGAATIRSTVRSQTNLQILQASAEVSIQAGNQSQALVFRSAIDRINELLAPEFGPDALQGKMGEDNSPEATANRILSMSTGFFDAYAAQHKGENPDELAKNFVDLIRGGFEQGFNDAKNILKGLDVLGGDVESGIMKTYELVSKGYDDFLAGKLSPAKATGEGAQGTEEADGTKQAVPA
ncbi:MAG TPA: DUF5610 domain-containing protein [Rhodocyclaceae bacterium]|nr:DUF5610 domain-containing protein [Rhodocyclaceae bacterium]